MQSKEGMVTRLIEVGCDHIAIAITRDPQGKPGEEWVMGAVELHASGTRGYVIHIKTLEDKHTKVALYADNVVAMDWAGIIQGIPCGVQLDCAICRDKGYSDGAVHAVLFDPTDVDPLEEWDDASAQTK